MSVIDEVNRRTVSSRARLAASGDVMMSMHEQLRADDASVSVRAVWPKISYSILADDSRIVPTTRYKVSSCAQAIGEMASSPDAFFYFEVACDFSDGAKMGIMTSA